ncbi:hypothetical protein QAD02_020290 [Eretmocerus hayati]|uniref:Uncharacterized protein n=1 Tax=Eretmocerus hayati TaxID=131215 RepID=A0ACC2PN22_9HYME|nr:hypothetical protein QAD02_020290 [Eretmocerus hayati]
MPFCVLSSVLIEWVQFCRYGDGQHSPLVHVLNPGHLMLVPFPQEGNLSMMITRFGLKKYHGILQDNQLQALARVIRDSTAKFCSSLSEGDDFNHHNLDCSENKSSERSGLNQDSTDGRWFKQIDPIPESDTSYDHFYSEERQIPKNSLNQESTERITIYQGCDLTREESDLLIMSLVLRYRHAMNSLDSMLKLLDCFLPHDEYRSKFRFLQGFSDTKFWKEYYCPDCPFNLKFGEGMNTTTCVNCGEEYTKKYLEKNNACFFASSLKDQLIEIIQSHLFLKLSQKSEVNDVVNGDDYQSKSIRNIIKKFDLSGQWNVDGIALHRSSDKGVTPLLFTINELDYRTRRDNTLLLALAYGQKPPMNIFLRPMVKELRMLYKTGFKCIPYKEIDEILVKVHANLASMDSVARAPAQNHKQYNAKCGCPYCFHEGERIEVGDGHARVYCGEAGLPKTDEK